MGKTENNIYIRSQQSLAVPVDHFELILYISQYPLVNKSTPDFNLAAPAVCLCVLLLTSACVHVYFFVCVCVCVCVCLHGCVCEFNRQVVMRQTVLCWLL